MNIFTKIKSFLFGNKEDELCKIKEYYILINSLKKGELCFSKIPDDGRVLDILERNDINIPNEESFTNKDIPSFEYFKNLLNKDGKTKITDVVRDSYKVTNPFDCSITKEIYNKAAYSKIPSKDILYSKNRRSGVIRRADLPQEETKNV